jgi:cytochrome c553
VSVSGRGAGRAAAVAALLFCASLHGVAQPVAERFATCLACHGPGGVSQLPLTPSLAGQASFYAITQLFLFREGRRSSEAMTAVAKGMSDADLRAFSDLIGKLPAPPANAASAADPTRVAQGAALAERFRCGSCHGSDFSGGQQVPRLAGQREDYLAKTLAEFRVGTRIGYTSAMSEALAGIVPDELTALASYLATFSKKAP